jgi:hypothetical protein
METNPQVSQHWHPGRTLEITYQPAVGRIGGNDQIQGRLDNHPGSRRLGDGHRFGDPRSTYSRYPSIRDATEDQSKSPFKTASAEELFPENAPEER